VRQAQNQQLIEAMQVIRTEPFKVSYGSPRMTIELRRRGHHSSENRIARLMREANLPARPPRAFRPQTTQANSEALASPNLLQKRAKPEAFAEVLVGDITYVNTDQGWLYLAVVMDLFSRTILGWKVAPNLATPLVTGALQRAIKTHSLPPGSIFHSDRGTQYISVDFRAALAEAGFQQSMSRTANCYDNATCESVFATLKNEAFPPKGAFSTKAEAEKLLFAYIEAFYNTQRLHSSLEFQAPLSFLAKSLQTNKLTLN
jgi:transposase InsO family protein